MSRFEINIPLSVVLDYRDPLGDHLLAILRDVSVPLDGVEAMEIAFGVDHMKVIGMYYELFLVGGPLDGELVYESSTGGLYGEKIRLASMLERISLSKRLASSKGIPIIQYG